MDDLITYLLNYAFDHGYGYEILMMQRMTGHLLLIQILI